MSERQVHGFKYEDIIIKKFNLIKEKNYTHKWDAYDKNSLPWQIKCIKQGSSIELGDYSRNSVIDKKFILHIGFWKDKKNNIVEEHNLEIDYKSWNELFKFSYKKDLKLLIEDITNERRDDEKWKKECKRIKQLWNNVDRKIQLRFKRDHKKQKRIQCAINKRDFYSYFIGKYSEK